jgi:hypothetical protein
MRTVRISKTFVRQLNELLAFGEDRFGSRVVDEKRTLVYAAIREKLALTPRLKRPHKRLKLTVYLVSKTPFMVLYDFDDAELRVHFAFQKGASFRGLDPKSAEW